MKVLGLAWVLAAVGMVPAHGQAPGPASISPPLGLSWGERPQQVEGRGVPIVGRVAVRQREAWTIKGFAETALEKAILYFGKSNGLEEVELQYHAPEWTFDDFQAFFASARNNLQEKYGLPVVLARYKAPVGDVMETVVCLLWQETESSVRLCYYSAARGTEAWRVVSLHYRNGPIEDLTLQASK